MFMLRIARHCRHLASEASWYLIERTLLHFGPQIVDIAESYLAADERRRLEAEQQVTVIA